MKHFTKSILALSTIFLSFSQTQAQCVIDLANVYSFVYNGDNYEIVKENLNWVDAAECAVERGGFLSEINTQEEQDSIFYHVNQANINANSTIAPDGGGASYLWIGGNDLTTEGVWVWNGNNDATSTQFWQGTSSGNPVNGLYNNWGNEPDDFGGQDGLGFAFTNWPLGVAGQWNDIRETNKIYYIIEYNTTTGIQDLGTIQQIHAFPIPATNTLSIEVTDLKGILKMYNAQGAFIQTIEVNHNLTQVNISQLANGIYFLRFEKNNLNTSTLKFTISR